MTAVTKKRQPTEVNIVVKLNHDLRTEDEWEADAFLWGWIEAAVNSPSRERKYFRANHEQKARAALVRALRGDQPLSRTLRNHLAELFDDASTISERRLIFEFRRRGADRTERRSTKSQRSLGGSSRKVQRSMPLCRPRRINSVFRKAQFAARWRRIKN